MAKQTKHKKYLPLDDVRVSYDPRRNSIVLTSGDRELQGRGGLKIDVPPLSSADSALRELLKEKGVIRDNPWPELNGQEALELIFRPNPNPYGVVIGTDALGEPVEWDLRYASSIWIHSAVGGGASVLKRSLFYHCVARGWDFYGIDLKRVELTPFAQYERTARAISRTIPETHAMLSDLESIRLERYRTLDELRLNDVEKLPEDRAERRILVLLESIEPLLKAVESVDFDERAMAMDSLRMLKQLARVGRAAGIHLAISGSSEAALLAEIVSLSFHIVVGRVDPSELPSGVRKRYEVLDKLPLRGSGMVLSGAGGASGLNFRLIYIDGDLSPADIAQLTPAAATVVTSNQEELPSIGEGVLSSGQKLQHVKLEAASRDGLVAKA